MTRFEVSPPLSIGGGSSGGDGQGNYLFENPYAGENCELMLLQVSADGAGDAFLAPGQEPVTGKNLTTPARVQWFPFTAKGILPGTAEWLPFEGKAIFTVQGASNIVLCVAWRREIGKLSDIGAFSAADRATAALGFNAQGYDRARGERTRWGADTWANVAQGRVRKAPTWRHQPGTQQSSDVARMAGDDQPPKPKRSAQQKLRDLLRTNSLQ